MLTPQLSKRSWALYVYSRLTAQHRLSDCVPFFRLPRYLNVQNWPTSGGQSVTTNKQSGTDWLDADTDASKLCVRDSLRYRNKHVLTMLGA